MLGSGWHMMIKLWLSIWCLYTLYVCVPRNYSIYVACGDSRLLHRIDYLY